MEWIKIEKKWHEMALRLQIASPRGHHELARVQIEEIRPDTPPLKGGSAALPAVEVTNKSVSKIRATA
jgi:hypothetical protein